MGRNRCAEYDHFFETGEKKSKNHVIVRCRQCQAAHERDPNGVPSPDDVTGRVETMRAHLARCPYVSVTVKNRARIRLAEGTNGSRRRNVLGKRKPDGSQGEDYEEDMIDEEGKKTKVRKTTFVAKKEHFHALLGDITFQNGLPFTWVESPSFEELIRDLRPAYVKWIPPADLMEALLLEEAAQRYLKTKDGSGLSDEALDERMMESTSLKRNKNYKAEVLGRELMRSQLNSESQRKETEEIKASSALLGLLRDLREEIGNIEEQLETAVGNNKKRLEEDLEMLLTQRKEMREKLANNASRAGSNNSLSQSQAV